MRTQDEDGYWEAEVARLRAENAEQLARGLTLAAEVDKLTEAIRLTVAEYPSYEEMDRIAAAIGLPGYLEREVRPIQTDP